MTGLVYVSPYNNVGPYVILDDSEIYRVAPHAGVDTDTIALNAIQRRLLKKFAGDEVVVKKFEVPMGRDFILENITVSAEYLKTYHRPNLPDLTDMANQFNIHFNGHVFQPDQKVIMQYDDENFLLTVQSDKPGLMCSITEVSINF